MVTFNWDKLIAFFFDLFKKLLIKPALPHPEESRDGLRTIDNTSVLGVRGFWYLLYQVPKQYHPFWNEIQITLIENLHVVYNGQLIKVPAATSAGLNKMELDPQWANPGILAHELAHISYSLLTQEQKQEFEIAFKSLLTADKLLKLVYEQKSYMQSSYVEVHADCYRYLGDKMPEDMKRFYPKLF